MTWGTYHGHAERRCRDCAERFYPRYGFERYCFPCWQDRQDREPRACSSCSTLRAERDEALAERDAFGDRFAAEFRAKREATHLLQQAQAERDRLRAELAQVRSRSEHHCPDWPHMLPRLIQLAHPDKHGGSHASNEATRWLLEQRAKLRR